MQHVCFEYFSELSPGLLDIEDGIESIYLPEVLDVFRYLPEVPQILTSPVHSSSAFKHSGHDLGD